MRPRILLRTHYQADEPRLIIASAVHCSSPTESRDEGRIAAQLQKWARSNGFIISVPGAIYAVGNSRQLGLLNNVNRWTARGLAFAYFDEQMHPRARPKTLRLDDADKHKWRRRTHHSCPTPTLDDDGSPPEPPRLPRRGQRRIGW